MPRFMPDPNYQFSIVQYGEKRTFDLRLIERYLTEVHTTLLHVQHYMVPHPSSMTPPWVHENEIQKALDILETLKKDFGFFSPYESAKEQPSTRISPSLQEQYE